MVNKKEGMPGAYKDAEDAKESRGECPVIGSAELRRLIAAGMIQDYLDLETQLQPNGFDLTANTFYSITGRGVIDFDNQGRKIPEGVEVPPDQDGWWHLAHGIYRIRFAEVIALPKYVCALGKPRSTLLRCGVSLETAVWDAGYSGRSESLLVVHNMDGVSLSKRARVMQMVFFRVSGVDMPYNGIYQMENLSRRTSE